MIFFQNEKNKNNNNDMITNPNALTHKNEL